MKMFKITYFHNIESISFGTRGMFHQGYSQTRIFSFQLLLVLEFESPKGHNEHDLGLGFVLYKSIKKLFKKKA